MDYSEETNRCLQLAVDKAHNSLDFSSLAYDCLFLFNHPLIAETFIRRAEDLASSEEDWQQIKAAYYDNVGEDGVFCGAGAISLFSV